MYYLFIDEYSSIFLKVFLTRLRVVIGPYFLNSISSELERFKREGSNWL